MEKEVLVNVAPTSTEGHFVKGAKAVVDVDTVNEVFIVKGESKLISKNHTDLEMVEDCLVTCQVVYDPTTKMFNNSKD